MTSHDPCDFSGDLPAYHDNELDARTRERLERHLPGCAACRRTLAGFAEADALVAGLADAPVPDGFAASVAALARREAESIGRAGTCGELASPLSRENSGDLSKGDFGDFYRECPEAGMLAFFERFFRLIIEFSSKNRSGRAYRGGHLDAFADCPPDGLSGAYLRLVSMGPARFAREGSES